MNLSNVRDLLSNAKKLRSSKTLAAKNHVFINADLTVLQRQYRSALREELKLRLASGEKDFVIRAGKIVPLRKP